MSDFDFFMEIPSELNITDHQREAINKLDLSNRRTVIKMLMKEQGIEETKETQHYGDATAKELDNYIKDYQYPKGKVRSGLVAPVKDLWRNFNKMNELELKTSDTFFHCKAHYEAASRGKYGSVVSTIGGYLKEAKDIFKYPIDDCERDLGANARGRERARQGKRLQATSPAHYKRY